jgi:hypothetical protein
MQGSPELPPPPPMQPRSVADILETAFDLYKRHWVTLVQLVAYLIVPLTLVQSLIGALLEGETVIEDGRRVIDEGAAGLLGGAFIVWLAGIFIQLLLIGAMTWAVANILIGREPDISDSYRNGYKRVWSILLVALLSLLAFLAGLVLLIIPGAIVLTRLCVAVPAVVVEQRKGTDALSRSWNLVKGFGWPVFGALIVTLVIAGIINTILTRIAGDSWFALWILSSIGSVVTTPFLSLVVGLIYFDLRVRKENLDVATLEREVQAAAAP